MSEGWRLGGHRVLSLDDISRYSDSMLASFQSLKDGRSEANFDGIKSEAEIASQCVDERMAGLERLRFFLFAKQATLQQRIVGIESIIKECSIRKEVHGASRAAPATSALCVEPGSAFVSDESSASRSVDGALAYAAALSSTPAGSPVMPAALPGSGSSAASSVLVLSDDGARMLETLLPELQRAVPQWEWDLQTRVASLYCDLLCAPPFEPGHPPGLLSRSRVLEPIVLPFLCRMLDQEEMSEEYLSVWMQPMMAAIDSLGASAPFVSSSPVAPSPLLSTTLLSFSLKQSKDFLLSQPINVRILCVHLLGALAKHLHWRTILSRVLDSVLALCQDTSGAVRFHMCKQIVHVLQAISPLSVHPKHAGTAGIAGSHSSCKDCPPALLLSADGTPDPSHPLVQLLSELEELLKDEERDCKIRAFQSLVATLPIWPDPLRRGRVAALVQKFIQVPPGRGMMMLIAQNLGKIVWQIRTDWWNSETATSNATAGAASPSSATSSAAASSSDLTLHHLVRTLIAFYKNLPFLSQTSSSGLHSSNGAALNSSANGNAAANSGSSEAQMLSPVSAAMLAHSHAHARSESASLPLSPSNAFSSLHPQGAQLSHEPRRYCAASFVAVASILGRVGAASAGAAASASSAAAASSSASSQPMLPETRFFIDHLSSLWFKLLKADQTDAASSAGSHSSSHGSSSGGGGSSGDAGSDEVRLTLIMSFWEVVNILAGVGSSLTRSVVAEANAAAIATATAQHQAHPSPQSSPSHASSSGMRKSSSMHGLAAGVVPLPQHQLPLVFQTAATAATTLHSSSAFKLTKDAFLSILHEHSNVHAAAPQSGVASSSSSLSSSAISTARPLSILTTSTGLTAVSSGGSSQSSGSGGSSAESFLYLIEGGKLESILDVYWRNHFGSVAVAAASPSSAAGSPSTPHGVSDAVADSWSSFMHDFLRGLLGFESCVLSASASSFSSAASASALVAASSSGSVYNWRHKISFWSSLEFIARHPAMHVTSAWETQQPPRGYTAVRPAYLSHLPQLHSASDLNNLSLFLDRIIPAAFHGMHTAPAPLKMLLSRVVTHVMLFAPLAYRRLEAVQRFLREFAFSRSYWDRLLFVQVCQRLMGMDGEATADERVDEEETKTGSAPPAVSSPPSLSTLLTSRPCSQRLFKKYFLLPLLTLVGDPVSSIRMQFTSACPRMLPALKRMMRVPGDQACVDAFNKGLASLKSAMIEPSSEAREGAKLTAVARGHLEQFKSILSKLECIEVARGPASGASHPPSPSTSHFSFHNATAASSALTASQLFEHGERRRESFEDSLLRIEEAWIADERHRAALSHSGGNLAAAAAALAAATNWTPQSFEAKPAVAGSSPNPAATGASATGSASDGAGSKTASTTAVAAKAKRASQTGTNLKAMQDAVSDAAANKQRKAGAPVSSGSSSAAGSSAQAHQAAALAASRVAAANKRNLLPGSSASAFSSSAASSLNAGSSANASAASSAASSASSASTNPISAASAGPTKSVRRYGSVPSSSSSSASASSTLAPSASSSAAASSLSAAHNSPAASVASILAVKNHARNTVETLLNRAVSGAAPSSASLGLPPPANSPPLGSMMLSQRREYDSKAGELNDDGPLAAAASELRPRRFAPVSTSSAAQAQSLVRVASAGNTSVPAAAALAGRRPVAGAPAPAGSAAGAATASPIVAPRSSKLLSANLSVSAARIVASAGNNSGATSSSSSSSASSNSPVLGGPRSGSPIVGGVRPGRAGLGRLPSQSTNTPQHQPLPTHSSSSASGSANSGSLSDRSNDSSGSGSISAGGSGHHHSNSLTHLSAAALLQMASEQRQASASGGGSSSNASAVAGRRQQVPRSTGASSPSLPAASVSSSLSSSSSAASAAAPLLPKLDGAPKLYSREPLAHAHLRKFKASNRAALPTADELRSERHAIKAAEEAAAAAAASITAGLTASGATVHRRRSLSGEAMAAATTKLGPKSSPRK